MLYSIIFFCITSYRVEFHCVESNRIALIVNINGITFITIFNVLDCCQYIELCITSASVIKIHMPASDCCTLIVQDLCEYV